MRFLILCNKLDVVEISCIKPCIKEILFREFLKCLFVEDILEMFKLGCVSFRSITHCVLHSKTYSKRKL